MKVSANIATYPGEGRLESLHKVIDSIYDQFDIIRIYFNEYKTPPVMNDPDGKIQTLYGKGENFNLVDNGKFAGLDIIKEPEYYFTLDDDLIYPPDYVEKTIHAMEMYGNIVTYHGRKLLGEGLNYYRDHRAFRCLSRVVGNFLIDVPGSGVMAFDTRYFHPKKLSYSPYKLMSDLVFAYECAKWGKRIAMIGHEAGWIKHLEHKETIFETEVNSSLTVQNRLADEIYKMRYDSKT